MELKEQLVKAIEYAISSDYGIWNRQGYIWQRLSDVENICLYGCGKYYEDLKKKGFLKKFFNEDRIINFICDNDEKKQGKLFETNTENAECISMEKLLEIKDDTVVLVTVGDGAGITKELQEKGIEAYMFGDLFLREYDQHYSAEWFESNREMILEAYDLMADEKSREIYTNVICNRIAPQYATLSFNDMKEENEYFGTDIFEIDPDEEYIVECGSYIGDSLEQYMEMFDNRCGAYYCFELDKHNADICEKVIERYKKDNIHLIRAGVSDKNEVIQIAPSNGFSSRVKGQGERLYDARIVKLDDELENKRVTYIKMDIEGEEIAALNGSKKIIEMYSPKLGISAYHYLSDMWRIPLLIHSFNSNYKIYMRHHTTAVFDTNCYAVK